MSLFNDPRFEQQMAARIRRRMLEAMAERASGAPPAAAGGAGPGGVMGALGGDPEDADYMVDIERRDLPDINPETGKPVGWTKKVSRKRIPRGK